MSSLIEGYNYDIFISYRQKDNKYDGWVTEFVDNLKKELESTFKEEITVYFDINPHDGLLETHDVGESLKEKLKCLVFIPIISRTYCDPKSFAWEHEFMAFVEQASNDRFGMKVKLPKGNVASRVLPVQIHELDPDDKKLFESVLGGFIRGIEFVYREPGVNRSLTPKDLEGKNLNSTSYRNQINKLALGIKEIISGLLTEPSEVLHEITQTEGPVRQMNPEVKTLRNPAHFRISSGKAIYVVLIASILITSAILLYPRFFKTSGITNPEKSVALMPFKNLTGDVSNDFLAEMHREVSYQELGKISQVKPLRIVGTRTTLAIENDRINLSKIVKEARLDYLIEGSVLVSGGLEEIMIRLIQVLPEEKLIMANNYSVSRTNIHLVYKTIAEEITRKIGLDLLPQDLLKLSQPHQVNPQSYEAYSRGMSEIEKTTKEGHIKGLEYLQEAVRIAPEDAFANAGLALGYLTIAHSPLDPGDVLAKGEKYAFRALMLDSTLAEVHAALAIAYLYKSWNFGKAQNHFKRALELNPNLDMAHYHYAWGLFLWGRMDEAIKEHKLAQKYDPYNPLHTAWLGGLYVYAGRYEEAVNEALRSLEIQKDYPLGYQVLGNAYLGMGRNEEAIKTHMKISELNPDNLNTLCLTYIATGHLDKAEELLIRIEKQEVTPVSAYQRSKIYAALGRKDEAFKWLNYEPHSGTAAWAAVLPVFEPLHDDPRWDEFLKKINLPGK